MILHLLAPDSGMISKGKQEQWQYIEEKLSPILLQAAVDAKTEENILHLATIVAELATLVEQEQDLEDAVNTAEDSCTSLEKYEELSVRQPDGGLIAM